MPYTLQDLVRRTGIPARTIRDYISRALLQGPDTRGRNARYSDYHLARLREIDRLKRTRRLSLAEIRAALLDSTAGRDHLPSSVREDPSRWAARRSTAPAITAGLGSGKSQALMQALLRATTRPRVPVRARAVRCVRIPITPEIDFSVTGELTPDTVALLEGLADRLRLALLTATSDTSEE